MKAYIPEKITYICRVSQEFDVYDEETNDVIATFHANQTWPIESGKSTEKAVEWAGGKKATIIEVENKPFDNVRVCDLEERGNGGRAYKVLVDEKYYVDLREDVLLSIILNHGIAPGGKLNAKFVWYKNGNHLKLINTDSAYYKTLVKNTTEGLHKAEKLKATDIIPGGIFQRKNGDKFLYLGQFHQYTYRYLDSNGYYDKGYRGMGFVKEKMHLAIELSEYNYKTKKPVEQLSFEELIKVELYYTNKTSGKPSYIRKIGQIEIDIQKLIENYVKKANSNHENNPYPHNRYIDYLSLGVDKPVIHPVMNEFAKKLPIKFFEKMDDWYDHLDEARKKPGFVIK
jgi:hypothetical protein